MEKYQGGCHCGAIRFQVELELTQLAACNCSICSKQGALRAFAPADRFELLQGAEAVSDYQFGKKNIHHLFCKTCGIASFGRGVSNQGERVSINVRCLDGVDLANLKVVEYDGKSR